MAKIESKADLDLGTNLKLHIADKGASDLTIDDLGDGTGTITSAAEIADFASSSESTGLVNRGVVVGDVLTLSHTGNPLNEGLQVTVTDVTANVITYDDIDTLTDEINGADVNLIATGKTYQFLEAGALSFIDGVAGIVLASEMVDLWDITDLDIYDPAFTSIEPRAKSMASINGWEPHDNDTLKALRDIALEIRATSGSAANKIYSCLRSGTLNAPTDQFTLWASTDAWDTAPTLATTTGYINELVLIYDAAGSDNRFTNGGITWITRCAEEGKTIIMEEFQLNYAEITPVSAANAIDPKLTVGDGVVSVHADYTNILYYLDDDNVYEGDVNSTDYDFTGYVDGDLKSNEKVHAKINYLWRQPTNINSDGGAGTTSSELRGDKQWPMTVFVGDGFTVQAYLQDYNAGQRNNLTVVDAVGTLRTWPIIYTLTINSDSAAYTGELSVIHADTFGTSAAVYLEDEVSAQQHDITIESDGSQSIVVAYSTYAVDGHTPGDPLALILTWNRPGYIEPGNLAFTMSADTSVAIVPKADPSYIA